MIIQIGDHRYQKTANSINSDLYQFSHTFLLGTSGLPNQNIAWAALQSHIKHQHKQTLSPFPFPQFKEFFFSFHRKNLL